MSIRTLLELYDYDAMRNALSAVCFRPQKILFLGDKTLIQKKENLLNFFSLLDYHPETVFIEQDPSDFQGVLSKLKMLKRDYPDLTMDVTGGRNLALLAAGVFTAQDQIPLFYYDWDRERFFNVRGCEFVDGKRFEYSIPFPAVLTLYGCTYLGSLHMPDSEFSLAHREKIHQMWNLFLKYQRRWNEQIGYIQQLGKFRQEGSLSLCLPKEIRVGEKKYEAPIPFLKDLQDIDVLTDLDFQGSSLSMTFCDEMFYNWMQISGVWLELELFLQCKESRLFDDVRMSVRADWDQDPKNGTNNELDVVATRGVFPIFFSCKSGIPNAAAIEEIDVLSKRFGGRMSRAVLVTATDPNQVSPAIAQRAHDMEVFLITVNDLKDGNLIQKLRQL